MKGKQVEVAAAMAACVEVAKTAAARLVAALAPVELKAMGKMEVAVACTVAVMTALGVEGAMALVRAVDMAAGWEVYLEVVARAQVVLEREEVVRWAG